MYTPFAGLHNCDVYSLHICICVSVQQSKLIVHVTLVVLTCALYCYLTLRVSFSLPQNHDLFTGFSPCFAVPCLVHLRCSALLVGGDDLCITADFFVA